MLTDPSTLSQIGRLYNELVSHTWTINSSSVNVASFGWLQNNFFSAADVTGRNNQPVRLSQFIQVLDCYPEGGLQASNGFAQPYTSLNLEDPTYFHLRGRLLGDSRNIP